jgi:hypothetical protein
MMMTALPRHKHGDDGHGNQCVPLETMRTDEGIVGYEAPLPSDLCSSVVENSQN